MTNPTNTQIAARLVELAAEIEFAEHNVCAVNEAVALTAIGLAQTPVNGLIIYTDLDAERMEAAIQNFENIVRMFNWEREQAAHTVSRIIEVFGW